MCLRMHYGISHGGMVVSMCVSHHTVGRYKYHNDHFDVVYHKVTSYCVLFLQFGYT